MIVEGRQCHLIDHTGRKYLDTRNNVAHVGHQNPQVVNAIIKQVSTLNTNSRYIHPNGVLLAKRLVSTLPPASRLELTIKSIWPPLVSGKKELIVEIS